MRLGTRGVVVIFGGSIIVVGVLLTFPSALDMALPDWFVGPARLVFWPVAICEDVVGPGPRIGPLGKQLMEGTPIHALAAAIGVVFSWMFWSSAFLLARRLSKKRD